MSFRIIFTEITIDADENTVGYKRICVSLEHSAELFDTHTEENPYIFTKDFWLPASGHHIKIRLELRLYVDFSTGVIHTKTKIVNVVTGEESTVFKVNEMLTIATYTAEGGYNG